jgi:hypothetical protein
MGFWKGFLANEDGIGVEMRDKITAIWIMILAFSIPLSLSFAKVVVAISVEKNEGRWARGKFEQLTRECPTISTSSAAPGAGYVYIYKVRIGRNLKSVPR